MVRRVRVAAPTGVRRACGSSQSDFGVLAEDGSDRLGQGTARLRPVPQRAGPTQKAAGSRSVPSPARSRCGVWERSPCSGFALAGSAKRHRRSPRGLRCSDPGCRSPSQRGRTLRFRVRVRRVAGAGNDRFVLPWFDPSALPSHAIRSSGQLSGTSEAAFRPRGADSCRRQSGEARLAAGDRGSCHCSEWPGAEGWVVERSQSASRLDSVVARFLGIHAAADAARRWTADQTLRAPGQPSEGGASAARSVSASTAIVANSWNPMRAGAVPCARGQGRLQSGTAPTPGEPFRASSGRGSHPTARVNRSSRRCVDWEIGSIPSVSVVSRRTTSGGPKRSQERE